jgi:hypothetical protein
MKEESPRTELEILLLEHFNEFRNSLDCSSEYKIYVKIDDKGNDVYIILKIYSNNGEVYNKMVPYKLFRQGEFIGNIRREELIKDIEKELKFILI